MGITDPGPRGSKTELNEGTTTTWVGGVVAEPRRYPQAAHAGKRNTKGKRASFAQSTSGSRSNLWPGTRVTDTRLRPSCRGVSFFKDSSFIGIVTSKISQPNVGDLCPVAYQSVRYPKIPTSRLCIILNRGDILSRTL